MTLDVVHNRLDILDHELVCTYTSMTSEISHEAAAKETGEHHKERTLEYDSSMGALNNAMGSQLRHF